MSKKCQPAVIHTHRMISYILDASATDVSANTDAAMWNNHLHPEEMPMPCMC